MGDGKSERCLTLAELELDTCWDWHPCSSLEEIVKNIEGNLEEDTKSGASEEGETPLKEEENLDKSSGEEEEMYLWDELEYKANYVRFIRNKNTEQQV